MSVADKARAEAMLRRTVLFTYREKERRGTIMKVLVGYYRYNRSGRGPKYEFIPDPAGRVYIKVSINGQGPKTFKWRECVDIRLEREESTTVTEVKPAPIPVQKAEVTNSILVPRMRPRLGG